VAWKKYSSQQKHYPEEPNLWKSIENKERKVRAPSMDLMDYAFS